MKRTPLTRRTPLLARKVEHKTPTWPFVARERPAAPPMDLEAARSALQRQKESATAPREYAGPVADPVKAIRPGGDGSFTPATRAVILTRDCDTCQFCGTAPGDAWPGLSIQHRIARMMGGTNLPHIAAVSNGVALCGSGTTGCHGWVERNPIEATRLGFAVAAWADPLTVPVFTYQGWRLLDDAGVARLVEPPAGRNSHASATRIAARKSA